MLKPWSYWVAGLVLMSSSILTGCKSSCPSCTTRQTPLFGTNKDTSAPRPYAVSPSQRSGQGQASTVPNQLNRPDSTYVPSRVDANGMTTTRTTLPPTNPSSSTSNMQTPMNPITPTSGSTPPSGQAPLPEPELPVPTVGNTPSAPMIPNSLPPAPSTSGSNMVPPLPNSAPPQP